MPNEDIEDYLNIKNNLQDIENYNFKKILKKYNSVKNIIMIILLKTKIILNFIQKLILKISEMY